VDGLPDGVFEVWANAPGESPAGGTTVRVPDVARIDLVLPGFATLKGRVVDPHDIGVSGASLVFRSEADLTFSRVVAKCETRADGTFDGHATGRWNAVERIDVRASGFATLRAVVEHVSVDAGKTHTFSDLALVPEGRLVGRVTGPDGPVQGADVRVMVKGTGHFGELETERATSGDDGTYSVGGLAEGFVVVTVAAKGLVQEGSDRYGSVGGLFPLREDRLAGVPETARAEIAEGATVTRDLRLVRTAESVLIRPVFEGVVRREDGSPEPWADVWASGSANHRWIADAGRTIARADGTFRLEAEAAPGDFAVQAAAPGFTSESVRMDVADASARSGLVLVVKPAPLVRGVVRSKLGLPVAGATVRAGTHHHVKFSETAVWDEQPAVAAAADGTFTLPLGPKQGSGSDHDSQGEELVVCAEAPGHAPALSRQFTWKEAAAGAVVDVELDAGAAIAGRVVDEAGRALADVEITLAKRGSHWNKGEWPPAYPPMPDEVVVARTDANGAFRIEHLVAAAYGVKANLRASIPEVAEVTAPAPSVEIRLRTALEIGGIVVAPDGTPIARARVTLRPAGESADAATKGRTRSAKSDDAGRFRFESVSAGTWHVDVVPPEDGPDVQALAVDAPAGATDLRLVTRPGLSIRGTLVDAGGNAVVGAEVSSRRTDEAPGGWSSATTDDKGAFALRRLSPGRHAVDVDIDEHSVEFGEFEAGDTPALRLPGNLTISGTARVPDGKAEIFTLRLRARLVGPSGPSTIAHTCTMDTESRTFEFRHLAPGRYAIEATWGGGSGGLLSHVADGTFLVAGATDAVLDVELRKDETKPGEKR
jgi:hypothetical protein